MYEKYNINISKRVQTHERLVKKVYILKIKDNLPYNLQIVF